MTSKKDVTLNTMMDILMVQTPEVIPVLLQRKIHCVGCHLARFHSVSDAAMEHDMNQDDLLEALLSASGDFST